MLKSVNHDSINIEPKSQFRSGVGFFFLGECMNRKTKKRLNTLDKYIIFSLTVLLIYTIAHTVIFALTGTEARVLDGLFYATFGLEILYCFLLKRFKLHNEAKIIFGKKKKSDDEMYMEDLDGG